MKYIVKTWNKEDCKHAALKITRQELIDLGISLDDIDSGIVHGEMQTVGPWHIPKSYRALVMSTVHTPIESRRYTAYGARTMNNIRQSGYELEGYVSIQGKKYSAFTSSQLFELEDGKLVNVAIIRARIR